MPILRAVRSEAKGCSTIRTVRGFTDGCRSYSSSLAAEERASWKTWLAVLGLTLLLMEVPARCAPGGGQALDADGTDVSGTLNTEDGETVPRIVLQLQTTTGGPVQSAYTGPSGSFLFEHVPPGSYLIRIRVPGYLPVSVPVYVGHKAIFGLSITLMSYSSPRPGETVLPNGSYAVSVRRLLIPGKARGEYQRGVRSKEHGETDDAIKHWKKSIKIFPQYAESYMQLSGVYANRGDYARALEAAKHAINIDSKNADAYVYLGYVYLKERTFPKARQAFEKAVKLSDSEWSSQFWLGKLLLDEKDTRGAYSHLLRAWQLNSQIPDVEIVLYDALLMLGRQGDALARLDDFIKRFPNSPLAVKAREQRARLAKSLGLSANPQRPK